MVDIGGINGVCIIRAVCCLFRDGLDVGISYPRTASVVNQEWIHGLLGLENFVSLFKQPRDHQSLITSIALKLRLLIPEYKEKKIEGELEQLKYK